MVLLLIFLVVIGIQLYRFVQTYFFALRDLVEAAQLILIANPFHRVEPTGTTEIRQLGELFNEFADRLQILHEERRQGGHQAQAVLEDRIASSSIVLSNRPGLHSFEQSDPNGSFTDPEQQTLIALSYTVFDTETTGLDLATGDTLLSLGAVRISTGRLLQKESFEQLVNPQRRISPSAMAIHGITESMVQDQPTVGQVLPLFQRFADNTILVAHNAAFDMCLFQLQEAQSGVKLTNPALDTLLLSTIVHPNQKDHSLEGIGQRLGVPIIGRHTALGDALIAAQIFLKLIPLLAVQGIVTLQDVQAAAARSHLAHLKY